MKKWKTNVPVLLIFFARPNELGKTFEQIKRAMPSTLLLWQDGPREGRQDDIENIQKCREIVEDIDWECTVYKNYHETNMGCDPSTHYAHKWAFTLVDKCIIMEDDLVVSESMFPFCMELLNKYEDDKRIDRICLQNQLGTYDNGYSYLFAWNGTSGCWATWKRVADTWESDYACLENEYFTRLGTLRVGVSSHDKFLISCRNHKNQQVPHWEEIVANAMLMNSRLVIVPTKNMVCNIGAVSENSTHGADAFNELPRAIRTLFNMDIHETKFPLKHPPYIVEDREFAAEIKKRFFPQSKVVQYSRKMETVIYRMRNRNFSSLAAVVRNKTGGLK